MSDKHVRTPAENEQREKGLLTLLARAPKLLATLQDTRGSLPMFVLARWMPARKAHWLAARKPVTGFPKSDVFPDVDCRAVVEELRRDGIFAGINLPDSIREEISAFASANTCFDSLDHGLQFHAEEHRAAEARACRMIPHGTYLDKIQHCAAARGLLRDPLLEGIAAHYLGAQARLVGTRLWWSFPGQSASALGGRNLTEYHYDLLDWRMIKFFFYVRAVDEGTGPHVYVRGSHRRRALRHQFTPYVGHAVEDVLQVYGAEQEMVLLGDAGFGFVEDPFGFHMGTAATHSARLALEISFGVSGPSPRRFYG